MAWAAGAFTRVGGSTHWVDDKNAAINIVASRHDTNDEDLAAGINFCLNKDSTSKPTADFTPNVDNTLNLGSISLRWAQIIAGAFRATASAVQGFGPVSAAFQDMTPDTGTFTVTFVGGTSSPTGTATWFRVGKLITLKIPALTATSNATSFSYSGLPAAIQPATLITQNIALCLATDNTAAVTTGVFVNVSTGSGSLVFGKGAGSGSWTAAGTKGLQADQCFSYLLL